MEFTGGIIAPVVLSAMTDQQANMVLQGLVTLGLRRNKQNNMACCVLSWVSNGSGGSGDGSLGQGMGGQNCVEMLLGMGFEVQQVWEEVINGVDQVSFFDP